MQKHYYENNYINPQNYIQNEDRFIGPIFPFLGGALIGYIAGRPQYNYPQYYPVYYPYYPNYYYYQQPYNNRNKFSQNLY